MPDDYNFFYYKIPEVYANIFCYEFLIFAKIDKKTDKNRQKSTEKNWKKFLKKSNVARYKLFFSRFRNRGAKFLINYFLIKKDCMTIHRFIQIRHPGFIFTQIPIPMLITNQNKNRCIESQNVAILTIRFTLIMSAWNNAQDIRFCQTDFKYILYDLLYDKNGYITGFPLLIVWQKRISTFISQIDTNYHCD